MACSILVSWLGIEPRTPSNESVKSWVLTTGQPGNFFHFFFPKLYWEYDVTFCEDWLPFKDQLHWCNISRPRSCEVHGNVIATKKKNLQRAQLFELLCLLLIDLWPSIYGQPIALLAGSVQFPAAIALTALSLYAFHGGLGNQITKLARIVCCCCCSQSHIQPMDWSISGSFVFHCLLEFAQIHVCTEMYVQ